jgi:beta-N-acetylhexosaminidase
MPSAQAVARADAKLAPKKRGVLAREHGELIGRAVKAFGFNTTLAPVVDLALPVSAEVMGTRAPAADPAGVVAFTREFLAGLAAEGVAGCGKHFPGLGSAAGDTHFVTPEIGRTFKEIWDEDLVPYRELHKQMPLIMTNHAAYPQTKSGAMPASASRFWNATVLRKQIGYRGLILTDDLEMGGILKFMPIEEAAVTAVRAGSDLLEICHSVELILRTFEALIAESEKSKAFNGLLLQRATEVERKRARLFRGVPKGLTAKQFEALRERVNRFREKVASLSDGDSVTPRAAAPAEHV